MVSFLAAVSLAVMFAASLALGVALHAGLRVSGRALEWGGNRLLAGRGSIRGLEAERTGRIFVRSFHGAVPGRVGFAAEDVVLEADPLALALAAFGPRRSIGVTISVARAHIRLGTGQEHEIEAHDVGGRLRLERGTLAWVLDAGATSRALRQLPIAGQMVTRGTLPLGGIDGLRGDLAIDLEAAGCAAKLRASIAGNLLDASLEVPSASADAVRRILPGAPVFAPASIFVAGHGTVGDLALVAEVTMGSATARATGTLHGVVSPWLEGDMSLRDLDIREVVPSTPHSRTAMEAHVSFDGADWSAAGTMREGDLPVRFSVRRRVGGAVEFAANADIGSARRLRHLTNPSWSARGRTALRARGRLEGGQMSATIALDAAAVRWGSVGIGGIELVANATGRTDAPRVTADLRLAALAGRGLSADHVRLHAEGDARAGVVVRLAVTGGTADELRLTTKIRPAGAPRLEDLRSTIVRNGEVLSVALRRAALEGNRVAVEGLIAKGFGSTVRADGGGGRDRVQIRLAGADVDLARLGRFARLSPRLAGRASADVWIDVGPEGARGWGRADLSNARVGALDLGALGIEGRGSLRGSVFHPSSLEPVEGTVAVWTDRLSIGTLCARMGCPAAFGQLPGISVGGRAVFTRRITQTEGDTTFDLAAHVMEGGRKVASLAVAAQFDLARVRRGAWPPRGADLQAHAELDGLALRSVPFLAAHGARGTVSGRAWGNLDRGSPSIGAELFVPDLELGRVPVGPSKLQLGAAPGHCQAEVRVPGISVRGAGRCTFPDGFVPRLAQGESIDMAVDAYGMSLAAIEPLVHGIVRNVRGKLDAHFRARGRIDTDLHGLGVRGSAHIRDGGLFVPALGREVRAVDVRVVGDGSDRLRIEDVTARVGSGMLRAHGSLDLDGLVVRGARGEISVPREQPLPVTVQGVSYGHAWGTIAVEGKPAHHAFVAVAAVPTLHVELEDHHPPSLENLDHNPAIVVLQPLDGSRLRGAREPQGDDSDEFRLVVRLELGDDVGVRRDDLHVELSGSPVVTLGRRLSVDGSVKVLGGNVVVVGKAFRIERGIVRWVRSDDPGDPSLDVDASYQTLDSTRVSVHLAGRARSTTVDLRSNPPKSKGVLLALIAAGDGSVGDRNRSFGAPPGTAPSTSELPAGVSAGILTSGLNDVLRQSSIPLQASISTTPYSTRASAAFDISEQVRLEYTRQFDSIQYGQPIDNNLLGIDWRFQPRWVFRTRIGDKGTTRLDLLWQRWY